jgi:hypothetical protein
MYWRTEAIRVSLGLVAAMLGAGSELLAWVLWAV